MASRNFASGLARAGGLTGVPRTAQVGMEKRRSDLARIDNSSIKTTHVNGFELIQDAGDATVEITFPVIFTEKPSMDFGGELDENQSPETGNFPTVSVVVVAWKKAYEDRVGGGEGAPGWYVGATLAVVTTGRADHRMWVHWGAKGKAITDPAMRHGQGIEDPL